MADVDRFRGDDRRAVESLYRRVFGHDAADANRLRWEWQYLQNPGNPSEDPQIWLAREGPTIVGQYATMPVRLWVQGTAIQGSWGMDVMVAPERQRQGLGEVLFRTWDRNVGASLGLGLSESSYRLFKKMRWPDVGPVPCLVKPLTRRAIGRPTWPAGANRLLSLVAWPALTLLTRPTTPAATARPARSFGPELTALWNRIGHKFDLAVCRDATYLNWKYVTPPHVRYSMVTLERDGACRGYAVYRHVREPRGRVTLLVDFLADPDDADDLSAILASVDRAARDAGSDRIRCFALHAGFRRRLKRHGFFGVRSTLQLVAKVNAIGVPATFYQKTDRWHVTLGDSDQDR